jgi:multicomponent Na+:H+ antiporter subunit D
MNAFWIQLLVIGPVLVPVITALLCVFTAKAPRVQSTVSFLGATLLGAVSLSLLANAVAGLPQEASFGSWPVPFGIQFRIDVLGAILLCITALMALVSLIFLHGRLDCGPLHPMLLPLIHSLLLGVGGAFATADLFNLYVWFEVMLIAAVGLLALGGRPDQLDASFKYFALNFVGTMILLTGVALTYGATGHLNFGALQLATPALPQQLQILLILLLGLAFLVKAAAFPFFAWLPASYHTLPAPVLALFAGLLSKVGVYGLLRILTVLFPACPPLVFELLGWIALITMVTGVLGAAYHWDMRRILAFHSVSQIGYILMAMALATPEGYGASAFYIVHHTVVKSGLFLIAATIAFQTGHYDLRRCGGLYQARPALAVLFLISAMSLVGFPPLMGFWAKILVVFETISQGRIIWTLGALGTGILTLYSMIKIWQEAFWKAHPEESWVPCAFPARARWSLVAILILTLLTISVGFAPEGLLDLSRRAATGLMRLP